MAGFIRRTVADKYSRIGAIDIGTNTVLYSLFDVLDGENIAEIHFERHSPRIGEHLKSSRRPMITEESYRKLLAILRKHLAHSRRHKAEAVVIGATNPFRVARNGREIQKRLQAELGPAIGILSSEREAYLSFLGAVGRLRGSQKALVVDMGGGSTELVAYQGKKRLAFVSMPEGAVSLTEKFKAASRVKREDFDEFFAYLGSYTSMLKPFRRYINYPVTVVGGTASALAYLRDRAFFETGGEAQVSLEEIAVMANMLAGLTTACRRKLLDFDKKRAEVIFAGAFALWFLFKHLELPGARLTHRGLRHGLALDFLSGRRFPA